MSNEIQVPEGFVRVIEGSIIPGDKYWDALDRKFVTISDSKIKDCFESGRLMVDGFHFVIRSTTLKFNPVFTHNTLLDIKSMMTQTGEMDSTDQEELLCAIDEILWSLKENLN